MGLEDKWSPVANDSTIISTSVSFLFSIADNKSVQLAPGNPVGPGPLEIVYEIYLPDDVEQGTVYEYNDSSIQIGGGGDELPVLGNQLFQITNSTDSAGPDLISTPSDESAQPVVRNTQIVTVESPESLIGDPDHSCGRTNNR